MTTFDYEVQFSSATSICASVDKDGNRTSLTTGTTPPATVQVAGHGIQIDLSGTPAAGDADRPSATGTGVGQPAWASWQPGPKIWRWHRAQG